VRHFDGAITAEHLANGKEKSATTTQLVSKITLSNGRTISYKYDEEERINKVIDSLDGIIVYDYDALGQLKTETVNGTVVNAMSYDNYGNITEKNGVAYTYDTSGVCKDLLTQVGTDESGKIEYDANGNPIKYLGHDLDWEKGRHLKRFDNITYTYNASGIRTSKNVNGITHTYMLDGPKILRETWNDNTLIPLYDNEDSVCGILYNNVPYYFIKNLQGDVIAIVNKDAETVARYTVSIVIATSLIQLLLNLMLK
jgi:YD repeat-containing protein